MLYVKMNEEFYMFINNAVFNFNRFGTFDVSRFAEKVFLPSTKVIDIHFN
jgi:hypothetical protein